MAVTAQKIAELAGVSRGTVDRALHNRGRVNPEVAARIRQIATELEYKPNLVGQALVRSRQGARLGVILQSTETPTMQIVQQGVRRAADELHASGCKVVLRLLRALDDELLLESIEELVSQGIQGLAISPNNTPELRRCINELDEQGIPVVTLNSDVPGSRRLCFVGQDCYRAGQTAACLMHQLLPDSSEVLPLTGHLNNSAHNSRLNGFLDTLQQENSGRLRILPFQPCFDRDDYAYEVTQHALHEHPDIAGIYVASNGQEGVCRAVEEEGRKGQIKIIAYDLHEPNMQLLQSDSLSFVIDQEAFEQGYRPPHLLYEYLTHKKQSARELLYTDISIRTKYNSDLSGVLNTYAELPGVTGAEEESRRA
ncbi:LacI family DNA-binding transcriptional regulator [Agathobaculum sp.]|uniref:LacI family DNA-binding transcriptional regulator n=1 Tax=Agathobaculum sp. TaxID=2048138 RepID=UPI0039A15A7A